MFVVVFLCSYTDVHMSMFRCGLNYIGYHSLHSSIFVEFLWQEAFHAIELNSTFRNNRGNEATNPRDVAQGDILRATCLGTIFVTKQ